jgi:hypothetical protein
MRQQHGSRPRQRSGFVLDKKKKKGPNCVNKKKKVQRHQSRRMKRTTNRTVRSSIIADRIIHSTYVSSHTIISLSLCLFSFECSLA